MIQLRALGEVDLRNADDGTVVGSVLNQPRRLALLVYLAVESAHGGVQRDRLLGVFWPDQSQDQARQALRTALHFLRRSLGSTSVEGHGGSVVLNPDVVKSDVAQFRAALEAGDAESALQRYGGDLLAGFYIDGGSSEFERWLDEARADLRRAAADSAWSLARAEAELGNAASAGAWARRSAQLFHGDEAAVRRSIELLGRVGDRAGALEAYQDLTRRLRIEFDASPSPETEAAIARVRGDDRGEPAPPPALGTTKDRQPATAAGQGSGPRSGRWSVAGASAAALVILGAAVYALWPGDEPVELEAIDHGRGSVIHVDDFRDFSPDDATADLAGALTMELMGRLSDSQALRVVSLARATTSPVASLRPTYILRGGLIRSDSVVRVTAILLDAASGATLDRISAETRLADPTAMTDELAESLARQVRRQIGRAVEDYERGASSRNVRALAQVREAIRDIEAADSLRAAGAAGVARAALAAADSQLVLAQAMAPGWSEPSVQRAEISYRMLWLHLLMPSHQDPGALERALRSGLVHTDTALAIGTDDPAALELRGLLRYYLGITRSAGSTKENAKAVKQAEADLSRATQLDAGRARAWSILSAIYESRGDYAAANMAARRAFRADPYLENAVGTVIRLFTTSLEIGDSAAARRWCGELDRLLEHSWLPQYCVLEQVAWDGPAPGADTDSVRRIVDRAIAGRPADDPARVRIEAIAGVALARLGAPDALAALRAASQTDDPELLTLAAWGLLILGEEAAAAGLLGEAAAINPRLVRTLLHSRRFESLRAEPRLQAALAGHP